MSKSSEIAVRLTNVSKNYMVYTKPHHWLLDFMGLGRLLQEGNHYRSFWALRDINLEIPVGGKYALIGRNGAGKSTLLRIISDNIAPTEGKVEVNGHVEALLQLGTGFNPEFSGRENIFNSLAYMGVTGTRAEEKFWDIVDFSELDEFIEQPVKTYSSGMYLRLAFSVATAIAPQILIIDEILGAGDMYFQTKCLGRMQELTSGPGTTVIFVSHSLEAAQRLCDTFVWIDRGRIISVGPSAEVRAAYEDSIRKQQEVRMRARNLRLRRRTLSALQAAAENGVHLLGRFVLVADDEGNATGPYINAIRLYTRGALAEEIRVGDAMDDQVSRYPSFVISDPTESTWGVPQWRGDRFTRIVQAGRNGIDGAKFALFLAHDDFAADDFNLELEIVFQDSSIVPCHLELNAGLAGLKHLLSLENAGNNAWKTIRTIIPKWIYALPGSEKNEFPSQISKPGEESSNNGESTTTMTERPEQRFGTRQVLIDRVQFLNEQGQESYIFQHGRPMSIVLSYHTKDPSVVGNDLIWTIAFQRVDGIDVTNMVSSAQGQVFKVSFEGKLKVSFDTLLLCNGIYRFSTGLFSKMDLQGYNPHFTTSSLLYDLSARAHEIVVEGGYPAENWIFRHPVRWEVLQIEKESLTPARLKAYDQ